MKSASLVGIVLIALGIIAFVFQGFTYTTREKAVDLGPLQVTKEEKKTVPLPPHFCTNPMDLIAPALSVTSS